MPTPTRPSHRPSSTMSSAFNPAIWGVLARIGSRDHASSLADRRSRPTAPATCRPSSSMRPIGSWRAGSRKPKFFGDHGLVERYSPGIGRLTRHVELLTPADIEERYRMPGGHWHHGELQADQMLMSRPAFGKLCKRRSTGLSSRRRLASWRRHPARWLERRPADHGAGAWAAAKTAKISRPTPPASPRAVIS